MYYSSYRINILSRPISHINRSICTQHLPTPLDEEQKKNLRTFSFFAHFNFANLTLTCFNEKLFFFNKGFYILLSVLDIMLLITGNISLA